jgi:hypothetical protein
MRRTAIAAASLLLLSACAGTAPPASVAIPAPGQPSLPSKSAASLWTLADVEVGFAPGADLSWFEATYGTDARVEERVGALMRIALTQAAAPVMNGGRHVTLAATVRRFRGLTAREVYAHGGPVLVAFDLEARDSVTGEVLAERRGLTIADSLPGGMTLLVAPGSQRSLITGLIRREAGGWLVRCCQA